MNDSAKGPLEKAKMGVAILSELIKTAGDNPDVREAGANVGKAALTITKTINVVLLPLAALNYGAEKARAYFTEKFPEEFSAKAAAIPADQLVEPKASIAGPALQGLAFAHEEPNLKSMYLSLLASAMDSRVANRAHPAFVEVIKQLDAEEAGLLPDLLRHSAEIPIVEFREDLEGDKGFNLLERHLMDRRDVASDAPVPSSSLRNAFRSDSTSITARGAGGGLSSCSFMLGPSAAIKPDLYFLTRRPGDQQSGQ